MAGFRINGTIRGPAPCKDCSERHTACWGKCPKDARGEYGYRSWQADIQKVKENRNAYVSMNRRKRWGRTDI